MEKPFLKAASDVNKKEIILEEAQEMSEILKKNPDFGEFVKTPVISAAEKKQAIDKIFSGRICNELLNLMYILIDKRRAGEFSNIVKQYKKLLDESHGFSIGTIYSAIPLTGEQLETFEEKTGRLIRKKVRLDNKLNTSIIGGVRIFIEGKVIDATVRKRLNDLKESLR